ncbi:MAG: integrase family protein [Firmicutes bacterium]|nr:integrase family protein [Bacillota bacterium]
MAKRGHGEGSVRYNKIKKYWEARFSYADEASGDKKRRMFTGKSQREAMSKGRIWLKDLKNGLLPDADKLILGEWIERWLADYVKAKVRPKSFDKYAGTLRCYVIPYLGKVPIGEIKSPDVQRLFNKLLMEGGRPLKKKLEDGTEIEEKRGISTSTVKAVRRYLSMAMGQAVKVGLLTKNIIQQTEAPKLIKEEIHPLTQDQATKLTAVAKETGKIPYMVVLLTLATGMRLGEVFGLKWDSVDIDRGIVYVRRALITGRKGYNGESFQEPKTAKSRRQIPLPNDVAAELRLHKEWQEEYKQTLGDKYHDDNLVFPNTFGGVCDTSNFTTRTFKKMLRQAEIDTSFKFHDLRHTHATMLLLQGVNPKIVQERLGHSTVVMTLDTYSHLLPDMQETASKALEGLFVTHKEPEK